MPGQSAEAPVPLDGAGGIDLRPILSWLPASNGTARSLHLWTDGPDTSFTNLSATALAPGQLLPGPLGWFPFFNTNPQNANDADFHVAPDGSIGVDGIGYSTPGLVKANIWYRIAFTADLAAGRVSYHLNGNLVHTGNASLDSRVAIYSNADPGPDLLLFNEGLAPGASTHAGLLAGVYFTGRALADAEVLALGRPKAWGIGVPEPTRLSISRAGAQLQLAWTGGRGPYQLQTSRTLRAGDWENMSGPTNGTLTLVSPLDSARFYRVVGQ